MKKRIALVLILIFFIGGILGYSFYINYKKAIKKQELFFNKQQLMQVTLKVEALEDVFKNLQKGMENFMYYFFEDYNNGKKSKENIEDIFMKKIALNEGLIVAEMLFSKNEIIDINIDDKASKWGRDLYSNYKLVDKTFYIPKFEISEKAQLMSYMYKINEEYTYIIVVDFSKLLRKQIKTMKTGKDGDFFVLDSRANVIYDNEKGFISKNIFDMNRKHPSIIEMEKPYISMQEGYGEYEFFLDRGKDQKVRKLSAWKSIELGDEKIIVCLSGPDFEIDYINISFLDNNINLISMFLGFIFLLFIGVFFNRRKSKKENTNKVLNCEKERCELALLGVNDGIWDWNIEEDTLYISKEWKAILRYSDSEIENTMKSWKKLIHPDDINDFENSFIEIFGKKKDLFKVEYRMREKSGKYRWVLSKGRITYGKNNELKRITGYNTDINQNKIIEKKLRIFYKAIDQTWAGVVVTDRNGIVDYINSSFTSITGYKIEEVIGKNISILSSKQHDNKFYEKMWKKINSGEQWVGEITNKRKNGEIYYEKTSISPIKNKKGEIENFISLKEDVTKEKELENKLKFYATKDPLTGALNRRTGIEFLERHISLAKRKEEELSIIFADINNLKLVNDNLGHNIGDELILTVVEVFEKNIRGSDIISRFGGDEFLIILPDCNEKNTEIIWRKICKHFELINSENERKYKINVSHGVEEYNQENNLTVENLIEKADKKMYEEKRRFKKEENKDFLVNG